MSSYDGAEAGRAVQRGLETLGSKMVVAADVLGDKLVLAAMIRADGERDAAGQRERFVTIIDRETS